MHSIPEHTKYIFFFFFFIVQVPRIGSDLNKAAIFIELFFFWLVLQIVYKSLVGLGAEFRAKRARIG